MLVFVNIDNFWNVESYGCYGFMILVGWIYYYVEGIGWVRSGIWIFLFNLLILNEVF